MSEFNVICYYEPSQLYALVQPSSIGPQPTFYCLLSIECRTDDWTIADFMDNVLKVHV